MKEIKTDGLTNTQCVVLPEIIKLKLPDLCLTNTDSFILPFPFIDRIKIQEVK